MKCWEFMHCGREPGGRHERELGACPAYPHHGRRCAHLVGTYCGSEPHGVFVHKLAGCIHCEFFLSEHYDRGSQPESSKE